MDRFEAARQKYRPNQIEYLFIAETPPKSTSNRFFYFENVNQHDSLFIETMKCLYPNDTSGTDVKEIRTRKKWFLEKFKTDGFYLIDSLDRPFEDRFTSSHKIRLIRVGQSSLLTKISTLCTETTKVVLISDTVYTANYEFLNAKNINVINTGPIVFPAFRWQAKFRDGLSRLLKKN